MLMLTTQDPGPWQYFVKRQDNIGLPIQQVTKKYLTEQMMYEYQFNQFMYHQGMMAQQGASQSPAAPVPTGDEEWSLSSTPWDEASGTWDGGL